MRFQEKIKIVGSVFMNSLTFHQKLNIHISDVNQTKKKKKEFKERSVEPSKCLNEDSSFAAELDNARNKLTNHREDNSKLKAKSLGRKEADSAGREAQKIKRNKKQLPGVNGRNTEIGNFYRK